MEIEESEDKIIVYRPNIMGQKNNGFIIYKNGEGKFRLKIYEQYCDLKDFEKIYEMSKKVFKDDWKWKEKIC